MRRRFVITLLLLQACSASMKADLQAPLDRCHRSALQFLSLSGGRPTDDRGDSIEGTLKDGRPVRFVFERLDETGTRVVVTVGRGESADEIAEAVRILERIADGADR